MAAVGQAAMANGTSQTLLTRSCSMKRRLAVHPEEGESGAVHGAAHVETAGQGDSHLTRHPQTTEVIVEFVHDSLDDTGSVDGWGSAVDPALGVDDDGDAGAGAADGELVAAGFELAALQVRLPVAAVWPCRLP